MSLEIIKNKYLKEVEQILNDCNFNLYELNIVKEFDSTVLQILVENLDKTTKSIDFDMLVKANENISNWLDNIEQLKDPYILEVASAGAERTVKTCDDLKNNIGSYFFIKIKKPNENLKEFCATLTNVENDEFIFNYFIKGRAKKINLKWDEIEFIRFAVKF